MFSLDGTVGLIAGNAVELEALVQSVGSWLKLCPGPFIITTFTPSSVIGPNQSFGEMDSTELRVAIFRRRSTNTKTSDNKSAMLLPQMEPRRPKNQVAGTPTTKDIQVAQANATNTDPGDSMARSATAGPAAALQKICPIANSGKR